MNPNSLPLIALACLLSACTSPTVTSNVNASAESGRPNGWIETLKTAWGEMPCYKMQGHGFKGLRPPRDHTLNGGAVLDILVNADGTIKGTSVHTSSGNPRLDQAAQDRFKDARYTMRLGPDDPAPHVVRLTVAFESGSSGGRDPIPKGYQDYKGAGPQPQT